MIKFKKQPAYSLLFAFFIMTVITVVSGTAIQNTTNKVAIFRNLESSTKARLAAESAAEIAILQVRDNGPGYNGFGWTTFEDPYNYGSAWSEGTAQSNTVLGGSYYFIPIPNTGSAAPEDTCSVNDSDLDPDHPCNWNKLRFGENVTIPMYADNFGGISSPYDLGMSEWYLRLRTPCTNGSLDENCAGGDRYVLDDGNGEYENDQTILFWQLTGEPSFGGTEALVPDDATKEIFTIVSRNLTFNTEVYESLINDPLQLGSLDYVVLEANSDFTKPKNQTLLNFTTDFSFEKMTLQMNIVNQLKDDAGATVPYLEWQLITSSGSPIADNKTVIYSDGYYTSGSDTYYFPFISTISTIGESSTVYTLSN